jgi:phage terminase large subunit
VEDLCRWSDTYRKITFSNGNKIFCAGLDDEEKIKSILDITIAWVEEATEFNEQDINQLDLRMRGETELSRELILSFNPVSELHWLKRKFFDDPVEGIKKNLFTMHSTFKDNLFLDDIYVERLMTAHLHDPNNYRVYVLGQWGRVVTGMEYYKNFSTEYHIGETSFDPALPLHFALDFNVVPYMSGQIWQVAKVEGDKKFPFIWEVRGLAELVLKHPKNSTEDMCYEFDELWGDKCGQGLFIYGDATGRNRKTSSKKTDYMIIDQILGRYIVEFRVPRSNPLPQDRHQFMNRMMFGGMYPIRMLVNPNMKYTIQDFTHVLEDAERKKLKAKARDPVSKTIVEKYGHLSDASDYLFMEMFKSFLV